MTLTPQQVEQMNQISGLNKPTNPAASGAQARIAQLKALAAKNTVHTPLDTIKEAASSGINQVKEGFNQSNTASNPLELVEGAAKMGAGAVNTVFSPLAPAMAPIGSAVNAIADKVSDIPAVQKFAQTGAGEATSRAAEDIANLSTIAGAVAGVKGAPEAVAKTGDVLSDLTKPVPPDPGAAANAIKVANKEIGDLYTKAIKPTIVGKSAPGQLEKYNSNVSLAIKSIVQNKPNLSLVDEYGDPAGKIPQSIDQFRQSIEQTKANIFKQYDTMASQAGDAGAKVDLNPIAGELQKVADNKIVRDLHPDLAVYAENRAKTLSTRGEYSTEDAQAAVQNLNRSLDAYYRNPSYETASKASVDSLIANQMREALDKSIENAGAPGYQGLRDQYAALKSIEKDVIKRGIVEARQTGGRGMNVGDIVSAEELIRGLATHNPAAMVTAGAIKGIQALRRYQTDPNRAIKQMFEKADAINQAPSSPETMLPTGKTEPLPNPSTGNDYAGYPDANSGGNGLFSGESVKGLINDAKKNGQRGFVKNPLAKTSVPKELQPLAQEAMKYKSAEEFANSFLYHGTKDTFDTYDLNRIGTGSTGNAGGTGAYFTDNMDVAKAYASVAHNDIPIPGYDAPSTKPGVVLMTQKPTGKFLDIDTFKVQPQPKKFYLDGLKRMEEAGFTGVSKDPAVLSKLSKPRMDISKDSFDRVVDTLNIEIANNSRYASKLGSSYSIKDFFLPRDGYDGVQMSSANFPGAKDIPGKSSAKDIILFGKNGTIKMYPGATKSQLTDFYNKVHGK